MAISNSIDGSSNSSVNQIFDLLAVMADPKAYNEKLKALQDANEQNQKLIQLVGPAQEIPALREKAAKELQDAKDSAKVIVSKAQSEADEIVNAAHQSAAKEKADADDMKKAASAALAEAKKKAKELDAEIAKAKAERLALETDRKNLAASEEQAAYAKHAAEVAAAAAKSQRDAIIAKHKAFIESLA